MRSFRYPVNEYSRTNVRNNTANTPYVELSNYARFLLWQYDIQRVVYRITIVYCLFVHHTTQCVGTHVRALCMFHRIQCALSAVFFYYYGIVFVQSRCAITHFFFFVFFFFSLFSLYFVHFIYFLRLGILNNNNMLCVWLMTKHKTWKITAAISVRII